MKSKRVEVNCGRCKSFKHTTEEHKPPKEFSEANSDVSENDPIKLYDKIRQLKRETEDKDRQIKMHEQAVINSLKQVKKFMEENESLKKQLNQVLVVTQKGELTGLKAFVYLAEQNESLKARVKEALDGFQAAIDDDKFRSYDKGVDWISAEDVKSHFENYFEEELKGE
jgi:hypothetical protein